MGWLPTSVAGGLPRGSVGGGGPARGHKPVWFRRPCSEVVVGGGAESG
jgi:hypothetical protein